MTHAIALVFLMTLVTVPAIVPAIVLVSVIVPATALATVRACLEVSGDCQNQ